MKHFILRDLGCNNAQEELMQIGFDNAYKVQFSDKFKHKNIKIYGLSSPQANILKQTALSLGADCAVHRGVITGNLEASDAILCGNISQIKKIAKKLTNQPFNLKLLANDILEQTELKTCKTKLVGILNITPDSFSDGGLYFESTNAINHLIKLIDDGADIIDIGAESAKPFSEDVSAEEQIRRLKPILQFIQNENISVPVSIDTRNSKVAEFCLSNGATIINDVSGFDYDLNMPHTVAKYNAGIIIQHSQGTPLTMQIAPHYTNIIEEIYAELNKKIQIAQEAGIKNIIIDPGIGFGKSVKDNFTIIDNLETFCSLNTPIMIGISRKSLLGVTDNDNELKDALSLAISRPLINKTVDYLRVHNIKLHKRLCSIV